MHTVLNSLSINIEINQISVSYINAQNVVLPLPDFDDQSQVSFPNKTIISESLFVSGIKADAISSVSKSLDASTFYWEGFLTELSSSGGEEKKQQELLTAIFHKVYRDAKVYLHQDKLSLIITAPQTVPANIFPYIVSLAKLANFMSAQVMYKELALMHEVATSYADNEFNTVLINWGEQDTYIGLFDSASNQQKFEYVANLNSTEIAAELSEILENSYYQECAKNLSQEGKDRLIDISMMIIDSFSIHGETKINLDNIIDGHYFSIQMNLHQFSSIIFPRLIRIKEKLSMFLGENSNNNNLRYLVKCDWFQMEFVKKEFMHTFGSNLIVIPSERSLISFGALKSLMKPNHDSPSEPSSVLVLPNNIAWGVVGVDAENGQQVLDTIHDASATEALPYSYQRHYQLMTNDRGECYLPIGIRTSNKIETVGSVTIVSQQKLNSRISIEASFTLKKQGEVSIDVSESQSQTRLLSSWTARAQANHRILEKMEMF